MKKSIKIVSLLLAILLGALNGWSAADENEVNFRVRVFQYNPVPGVNFDRTYDVALPKDRFPLDAADFVRALNHSITTQGAYGNQPLPFDLQNEYDHENNGRLLFKQLLGPVLERVTLNDIAALKANLPVEHMIIIKLGRNPNALN